MICTGFDSCGRCPVCCPPSPTEAGCTCDLVEREETAGAFRAFFDLSDALVHVDNLRALAGIVDDVGGECVTVAGQPVATLAPNGVWVAPIGDPGGSINYYAALAAGIEHGSAAWGDRIAYALGYATAHEIEPDVLNLPNRDAAIAALGRAVVLPEASFAALWTEVRGDAAAIAWRVGCTAELVLERARELGFAVDGTEGRP